MLAVIPKVVLSLLKSYIVKLATEEFAHWAFMQLADALVKSTKTQEDDKWLKAIKKTIESK